MDYDEAHVLLDGLLELEQAIKHGMKPWEGYDAEDDDPKADAESYTKLIQSARQKLEDRIH